LLYSDIIKTGGIMKNIENPVAVYSTRSLYKDGVGRLSPGYNIVSEKSAEFWTTVKAVRLATPEEVARAYGKGT
jgi:hypothetical protein